MNKPRAMSPEDERRIYKQVRDGSADQPDYKAWLAQDDKRQEKDTFVRSIWNDPVFNEALQMTQSRVRSEPSIIRPVWMAAAAGIVTVAVMFAVVLGAFNPQPLPKVYQTAAKEIKQQGLADGSVADLNARTRIGVHYSSQQRHIQLLDGEARFSVTKDAARPFTVETRQARMQALGTIFNVDQRGPVTELSVYEGRVAITPAAPSGERRVLTAGERLAVTADGLQAITRFDPKQDKHWLNGWISVDAMPLSQLLIKLNRFASQPMQAGDAASEALLVSGSFKLAEPEKNLNILARLHNLEVQRGPKGVTLRKR